MKRPLLLLLAVSLLQPVTAQTPRRDSVARDTKMRVDTLRQVEVRADSQLRVNDAIRQTLERERAARIGTMSVSDVIGSKLTDKIMHPFAVKERRREKKHARDRQILKEYEELGRDQLASYLTARGASEGYLVTFDFSKKREVTEPRWIENKGKRIFEVTI